MINKTDNNNVSFQMNIRKFGGARRDVNRIAEALKDNEYAKMLDNKYIVDAVVNDEGLSLRCFEKPSKTTKVGSFISRALGLRKEVFSVNRDLGYDYTISRYFGRPDGFWFSQGMIGKPAKYGANIDLSGEKAKEVWCWDSMVNISDDIIEGLKKYIRRLDRNPVTNPKANVQQENARRTAEDMIGMVRNKAALEKHLRYEEEYAKRFANGEGPKIVRGTRDANAAGIPTTNLSQYWDFNDLPRSFSCTPEPSIGRK